MGPPTGRLETGQELAGGISAWPYEIPQVLTNPHGGKLPDNLQNKPAGSKRSLLAEGCDETRGMKLKGPERHERGRSAKPKCRSLLERLDKRLDLRALIITANACVPFSNNPA